MPRSRTLRCGNARNDSTSSCVNGTATPPTKHLIGLGTSRGWQNSGLRAYLLADRHHALAQLGLPACLDTDDHATRQWCRQHGYFDLDIGDPITLPGARTRIWPMWRPPAATDNCTS